MNGVVDLIAREAELGRLAALVASAREGTSGALVLRGEPGMGKTALAAAAVEMGEGMTLLRARGVEGESRLPYAGLSQLLLPVLAVLPRLHPGQRAPLEAALSLGPPGEHDAVATGAALLDLLATVAEETPLLVVVDDLHWFDAASRAALQVAAHRARAEGIALLLATRPGPRLIAGIEVLDVERLPDAAARDLLARVARLGPDDARRVLATAAGNPLALREIPRLLRSGAGASAAPAGPLPAGATLERALREPLEDLAPEARRALLVAAVDEQAPRAVLDVALAHAGLHPGALAEAEAADLVRRADDGVTFRHPLLRSAVYHGATGPARRAAHAALAASWPPGTARWTWHAAGAALGPDETVAQALAALARQAAARGAHDAAARAWRRAADLSPGLHERFARHLSAADALLRTGRVEDVAELLHSARAEAPEDADFRDFDVLRGRLQLRRDTPQSGHAMLVAAAERLAHDEPLRAAEVFLEATIARMQAGDVASVMETAERALRLAEGRDPVLHTAAELVHGMGMSGSGRIGAGERVMRAAAVRARRLEASPPTVEAISQAAHVALWGGLYGVAGDILDWLERAVRRSGSPGALGMPLAVRSRVELRRGMTAEAFAIGSEAVELGEETGQLGTLAHALGQLADVEAVLGREADCRRHAEGALALAHGNRGDLTSVYPLVTLGLLELGRGDIEPAVEHLQRADAALGRLRLTDPGFLPARPLLVEALVRQGETDEAARLLDAYERRVEATGRATGRALAAHCRGLLAADDAFEAAFAESLAEHRAAGWPFARARAQLALGERRRRAKRRAAAREPLTDALRTFEALGASAWAGLARRELELCGPGAANADGPPSGGSALDELTPQELRVALLVGRGMANRQIAAALFVSTRTVEAHLRQVFRKLGVRSRTELARMVAGLTPPPHGAAPDRAG